MECIPMSIVCVEKKIMDVKTKLKFSGCVKDHETRNNMSYAEAVRMKKLSYCWKYD